jgi:hypothetical protein
MRVNGMKKDKIRAHCRRCRHQQTFVRDEMHHGLHLFFSVMTLGLWTVSWLAVYLGHLFRPWRCEHCRWHKPEYPDEANGKELPKPGPLTMSGTR